MKKLLIIIFYFSIVQTCAAQTGDMIVLKKKNQTVKTFMKGVPATFVTTSGNLISVFVQDVKNDSLYYKEVIVRQVPTQWGVSKPDTMATLIRGIHYQEIAAVPKRWQSFSYIRDGSIFMIGGAGYLALNVANTIIGSEKLFDKENIPRLVGGAAAFGVGKLMQTLNKKEMVVGKKYTLQYIKLK